MCVMTVSYSVALNKVELGHNCIEGFAKGIIFLRICLLFVLKVFCYVLMGKDSGSYSW